MRFAIMLCLLTSIAHAELKEEDREFCTKKWPKLSDKAADADMERCGDFYRWASVGDSWVWELGHDGLGDLFHRFADCKADCCDMKCDSPQQVMFEIQRLERTFFEMTDPLTKTTIEPTFEKLLTGKLVTAQELEGLSSLTLWKFRNAPYARHGKVFKTRDLAVLFYKPRAEKDDIRGAQKLLPIKQQPGFKESMLDKIDKANVSTVLAAIKKRGG